MVSEKNSAYHCIDYAGRDLAVALNKIFFLFCIFTRTVGIAVIIFLTVILIMQLNKPDYLVKNLHVVIKMQFTFTHRQIYEEASPL